MADKKHTAEEIKVFAEQVKAGKISLGDVIATDAAKGIGSHFNREAKFTSKSPLHSIIAKLNVGTDELPKVAAELHNHVETAAKHVSDFGAEASRAHAAAAHKLNLAKKAKHLTAEEVLHAREQLDAQLGRLSEYRKNITIRLQKASQYIHDTTKVAPNMATSGYLSEAAADIKKIAYAADRGWIGRRSDDIARTFKAPEGGLKKFGRVAGTGAGVLLVYDGSKRVLRGVGLVAPKIDQEGKEIPVGFGSAIGGLAEDAAGIAAIWYSLVNKGRGINLGK